MAVFQPARKHLPRIMASSSTSNRSDPPATELNVFDARGSTSTLLRVLAWVLFVLPVIALCLCWRLRVPIIWADDVSVWRVMRFDRGLSWSGLFQLSNIHLIVPTKLAIYFDYLLSRGTDIYTTIFASLLAIAICVVFGFALRRFASDRFNQYQMALLWAASAALYLNGNLFWTITDPILTQHVWTNYWMVCAAFLLAKQAPFSGLQTSSPEFVRRLFGLMICGVLAAIGGVSGLLVLPSAVIIVLIITLEVRCVLSAFWWKWFAGVAAATILVASLYLWALRLDQPQHASEGPSFIEAAKFVMFFLGGPYWRVSTWPVSFQPNLSLVETTCALFTGILVWTFIRQLRTRRSIDGFQTFHLFILLFVFVTAIFGSLNRASLGNFEGLNRKYPATTELAWVSAFSLCAYEKPKSLFRGNSALRPLGLCAAILALISFVDLTEYRIWRYWKGQLEQAAMIAASGVFDVQSLRSLYYDPERVFDLINSVFRPQRLYFFRNLPDRYNFDVSRIQQSSVAHLGTMETRRDWRDETSYVVGGDLSRVPCRDTESLLFAVDASDKVVGYGYAADATGKGRGPLSWTVGFVPAARSEAVTIAGAICGVETKLATISLPRQPELSQSCPVPKRRIGDEVLDHTSYGIEEFNGVATPIVKPPVHIGPSESLHISGWAVDRFAGSLAPCLQIMIDDKEFVPAYGTARPDVAAYLHQQAYVSSGFSLDMPANRLGRGQHELRVTITSADGTVRRGAPITFYVD